MLGGLTNSFLSSYLSDHYGKLIQNVPFKKSQTMPLLIYKFQ